MQHRKIGQIVAFITVIIVILLLFYLFSGPKKIKNKKETVAALVDIVAVKAGFDGKYEFIVENQRYETFDRVYEYFVVGDKFVIGYNEKEPKKNGIYLSQPVFLESENKKEGKGEIIELNESSKRVVFSYTYDGIEFKRFQRLPNNYKELFGKPTTGNSYKISIWHDNPQRAIIHLDAPL